MPAPTGSRTSRSRSTSGPGNPPETTTQAGASRKARPKRRSRNLPAQYRTAIVGVLPFANLSESADEYFSDGLTEDLIHALSLQSFYRVLSREFDRSRSRAKA